MQLSGFVFFTYSFNKNVLCPYYMPGIVLEDIVIEDTANNDFYGLVKKTSNKNNNYNVVPKRLWEICIQPAYYG